jgi:hypothetical protein
MKKFTLVLLTFLNFSAGHADPCNIAREKVQKLTTRRTACVESGVQVASQIGSSSEKNCSSLTHQLQKASSALGVCLNKCGKTCKYTNRELKTWP